MTDRTEYLVRTTAGDTRWHIAYPGVLEDDTTECNCDGGMVQHTSSGRASVCPKCNGTERRRITSGERRQLRLAWFDAQTSAFIAFDYQPLDVSRLPGDL